MQEKRQPQFHELHDSQELAAPENMRTALPSTRFGLNRFAPRPLSPPALSFSGSSQWNRQYGWKKYWRYPPVMRGVLLAALSPITFLQLAEKSNRDDTIAGLELLAASRNETKKAIPDGANGMAGNCRRIYILLDRYIFEPLATGFRFLRLVIIFVPVIAMVPVIWFGRRVPSRDRERTGTLWWYGFLVASMERAGVNDGYRCRSSDGD